MIETRSATIEDAERISALLMANASDRGGALYGNWSIGVVTKWITDGAPIIVAMDGPKLAGVLFTSEKAQASALPVVAMLKAWPGSADAYVYGPVRIDQAARGQGVLEALYAHVAARLPDRGSHPVYQRKQYPLAAGPRQAGDGAGRELHAWRRGFYRSQHPKYESRSQVKLPIPAKNQGYESDVARVDHRRALANGSFWRKAVVRRANDHAGSESLVEIAVVPEGEGAGLSA